MTADIEQDVISDAVALFTILFDEPFDYQEKFLLSKAKRICFRSGRQIGKSTVAAIIAIYDALNGPNRQILILSPTLRQSSLMFRKIRAYFKHPLICNEIVNESNTMIILKNGSEIHCLPGNNPDTIRGFSPFHLIIDESAFVKDEVYVAAEPSLAATNGKMTLISTPYGKRGRFFTAFSEDEFEKYHVPSKMSPLITEEFLDNQRKSKTDLEFKQEYEGEFLEQADTFFELSLIKECIGDIPEGIKPRREYILGIDCARYGLDETTYCIIEIGTDGIARLIFMASTTKKPITDIINRTEALCKEWNVCKVYMDSSGLGAGAVDILIKKGIPIKNFTAANNPGKFADSVQFTLVNKEEMYKNLKLLMEQHKLIIPKHDKLIRQMADLQYEFTEAGHMKIHHPDTPNAHDDWPDALALACLGAKQRGIKGYFSI